MKTRKIIATFLAATMVMGLAACSNENSSKKKSKKDKDDDKNVYIEYAKDLGYKEYDVKKAIAFEEGSKEYEDGICTIATEADDIKKLGKTFSSDVNADDLKEIVYAEKIVVNDYEDEYNSFGYYVLTFNNVDDASDFFSSYVEDMSDSFEARSEELEDYATTAIKEDDDSLIFIMEYDINGARASIYTGFYLEDDIVIALIGTGYYSAADEYAQYTDDFAKEFHLKKPSSVL